MNSSINDFLNKSGLVRVQIFSILLFLENSYIEVGIVPCTLLIILYSFLSTLSNMIILESNKDVGTQDYGELIERKLGKRCRVVFSFCNIVISLMNILFYFQISASFTYDISGVKHHQRVIINILKFVFFSLGYFFYFNDLRSDETVKLFEFLIYFSIGIITLYETLIFSLIGYTKMEGVYFNRLSLSNTLSKFHNTCFISWGFYSQHLVLKYIRNKKALIKSNIISALVLILVGLFSYTRYGITSKIFVNTKILSVFIKGSVIILYIVELGSALRGLKKQIRDLTVSLICKKYYNLLFEICGPVSIFFISLLRQDYYVFKVLFYCIGPIVMYFIPFLLHIKSGRGNIITLLLLITGIIFMLYSITLLIK